MTRFGVSLTFIGLVSVGLHFIGYQLRYLMWAEPIQPWLGAGVGAAGLALIGISVLRQRQATAGVLKPGATPAPGQYVPQASAGQHPHQPGQSPYGYPNQQYSQQRPPQFRS